MKLHHSLFMNLNHKKHWTDPENQRLCDLAEQAKVSKLSPDEFCRNSATDFGRKPDGLFLQLGKLGLLNNEVKWSSAFSSKWQSGEYKTISWSGLRGSVLMAPKDSNLKLVPFNYPKEDEEELSKFFRIALDNSTQQFWLGIENGPTGLGKTHYLTHEIIKAVDNHLNDITLPKLSIILVAPQHRHLDEIKIAIEKRFQQEKDRVIVVKASPVIEMAKSQSEYLPSDCPHINNNDKQAEKILEQMESFFPPINQNKSNQIDYPIGSLISDLRNKLRREHCKKFIETTFSEKSQEPSMCQQCRFMHIGKVMFSENDKHRVSITFSTYDKLFYGFDTYRISHKKRYVKEFFSPWVSEKTGNLKPIKNAVIFMEESSAGFGILWGRIQEAKLRINLTELVNYS